MTARNDVTGDLLKSKQSNDNYRDNYDKIFRKKSDTLQPGQSPSGERETAEGEQRSSKESRSDA